MFRMIAMHQSAMADSDNIPTSPANVTSGEILTSLEPEVTSLTPPTIAFAVLMSICIITTVVGNILVVLSVFTYRPLRGVQNYYIVSLAVADIAVSVFVMPFHVANSVAGFWPFGAGFCNVWLTFDILMCTASILHLCAIAGDRYFAIHDPINYAQKRTLRRVLAVIAIVWMASAVISIPPLFGWNNSVSNSSSSLYNDLERSCQLTDEPGFVVYSASGSFFIPLVIMAFLYAKIYLATRERLRKRASSTVQPRFERSPTVKDEALTPSPSPGAGGGGCSGIGSGSLPLRELCRAALEPLVRLGRMVDRERWGSEKRCLEEGSERRRKKPVIMPMGGDDGEAVGRENGRGGKRRRGREVEGDGGGRPVKDSEDTARRENGKRRREREVERGGEVEGEDDAPLVHTGLNNCSPGVKATITKSNDKEPEAVPSEGGYGGHLQGPGSNDQGSLPIDENIQLQRNHRDIVSEPETNKQKQPRKAKHRTKKDSIRISNSSSSSSSSSRQKLRPKLSVAVLRKDSDGWSTRDPQTQLLVVSPEVRLSSTQLENRGSQLSQILENRAKISLAKERRAARTMAVIMSAFVLCWLPFFLMYVIFPFCPSCQENTDKRIQIFIVWLGYINSTLNPIIYTIFNIDFRRAFKSLLQGNCKLQSS